MIDSNILKIDKLSFPNVSRETLKELNDYSEEIIQSWISKAFYAPRPPVWFCEKCNYSENWSPVCKKCKSFDSITWGTQEINNVFSENKAILPFEVDNKTKTFERKIEDAELVQVSKEEENRKNEN